MFYILLAAQSPIKISGTERPHNIVINFETDQQMSTVIPVVVQQDLVQSRKFKLDGEVDFIVNVKISRPQSPERCLISLSIRDGKSSETKLYTEMFDYQVRDIRNENWRELAHKISNFIYEKILFDRMQDLRGHFLSKIAYVVQNGPRPILTNKFMGRRVHHRGVPPTRLILADYDGGNPKVLVESQYKILGPRFSPCGRYLLYRILNNAGHTAFVYDLKKNQNLNLTKSLKAQCGRDVLGPNISDLRFGINSSQILIATSSDGTTRIKALDLSTNEVTPLTQKIQDTVQTCPSYSPEGFLTFSSDQGGSERLYIIQYGITKELPLSRSFSYSQAVWTKSPSKKHRLVFSARGGGSKSIWLADYDPSAKIEDMSIKTLAMSYDRGEFIESPNPSCNGQFLIYIVEKNQNNKAVMINDKGEEIRGPNGLPILSHLGPILDIAWSMA